MLTEEEVDDLMVLGLSDEGSQEDPEASLTVWDLIMALVTVQS
jgi:hypothetical protein